jgi:hypothetical protein
MGKRIVTGVLWFFAVGWGMNYLAFMAGTSQAPGLIVAAVVATLVAARPFRHAPAPQPMAFEPTTQGLSVVAD